MGKVIDKAAYFKEIGYEPHEAQWGFHKSLARFKIAVCGRRFGKTQMTAKDIEPLLLIPGKRVWLVGSTYALGEKEFRVIWQDMMVKLGFGKDNEIRRSYNLQQGSMFIEFPWDTKIEVKSADRKDTLVGDGLDLVVMCEACKHTKDTWERFLQPALSDKRGSAIFTTTPHGQDWVYELWQLGMNEEFPDYESWQYPSWENRIIYPTGADDPEIIRMQKTMSNDWFLQEIGADFTSFSGKIYGEFVEKTHVVKHEYRPDWPNYIAFDFGFVNPLAAIEFQIGPQDTIHIWREHYMPNMTMDDHIFLMQHRIQPPGYKIDLCFGDAADPEAVEKLSREFCPTLADPVSKENWREGVETVKRSLKMRENGVPGLTVDPRCRNTIREFNNYKSQDTGKADRNPREDAKKNDDHAMDAIRYGLVHIFILGARTRLSDVIDPNTLKPGLSDSGYISGNSFVERFPNLSSSGFVTLGGQRF